MYDEVILISVLTWAQTVEKGGGNDWNIFFYFLDSILLILDNRTWYETFSQVVCYKTLGPKR